MHAGADGLVFPNHLGEDELAAHAGGFLRYISVDGLLRAIRGTRGDTLLACFTGTYPEAVADAVPRSAALGARR